MNTGVRRIVPLEREVMNALLELFRHKTWATLRLIELCQSLAAEDLGATIPGTFGTIRETLRHLVDSEEGYFSILTRERFRTRDEAAAFVRPERVPDGAVMLDELAERIRRLGPRWEDLAQDTDLPGREVTTTDGWRIPEAVAMAQAIHHADDHRSHVLSSLGARGVVLPDLAVWGYAEAAGSCRRCERTSESPSPLGDRCLGRQQPHQHRALARCALGSASSSPTRASARLPASSRERQSSETSTATPDIGPSSLRMPRFLMNLASGRMT